MKKFTLTEAELELFRGDLGRRLPQTLRHALEKLKFDPEAFIRNRDELLPGTPFYPPMAGMRHAGSFSFDTACRLHSLHCRWYPGIGAGGGIHVFADTAMDGRRCFCREELLEKVCGILGCGSAKAENAFLRLFGGSADLETTVRQGMPMARLSDLELRRLPLPEELRDSSAWRDLAATARDLPENWHIHLQLSDAQLERYRWIIREYGSHTYRVAVSGEAATRRVRELRGARGEFIRRHSAESLRELWRDSGVLTLGEHRLKREVFMLGVCRELGIAPVWRFCSEA